MRIYEGIADAGTAARNFFIKSEDELPPHVRDKIQPYIPQGSSPVDLGAAFVESAFANPAGVPKEMLEIAAGFADIFDQNGYHGRLDGRAAGISLALRRESGETAPSRGWPKKADDPDPKRDFVGPVMDPPAGTA